MISSTYKVNGMIILSYFLVIIFGLIDYLTGWELNFFVFYFIPIALSSWYTSLRSSLVVTFCATITWFAADYFLAHTYTSPFIPIWNTLIRLIAFILIAFYSNKTARLLAHEREITKNLKNSMDQIKILRGFLPICSSCKKIRNDKGYWEQIEKYIHDHSEADFTHGLCEECAHRLYPSYYTNDKSETLLTSSGTE